MKKIGTLIMLLFLLGFAETVTFENNWAENPLFNITTQTSAGLQMVFSMHQMAVEEVIIDGTPMKSYGVPAVFLPQEGAPHLTGATRYIAIPQGAEVKVTILDARTETYHNIEIAPASNYPAEIDDSPLRYEKDMTLYGKDAYFPTSPVSTSEPMKMRGVDVVLLGIIPFQYNPVTKELIVYKDLKIRVDFIGGNGHFGEDRLRSRFWEPILQGHLLNYSSLPKIDFYAPERINARAGWEYIIIVPDDPDHEAWGDTIKTWRKLQGISSEVFTLTEVGGSTTAAIKNFLQNAYTTWDPAPAAFLLLSDYPSSGERAYGITSMVITHPWGYPAYASDNWFADFDNDVLPDLHHGRICSQDAADLSTMVGKLLELERNPPTAANFYDEPLVACGWQTSRWFQMCIEICRGFFVNDLGKNPAHQYNIYSGSPFPGCAWTSRAGSQPVIDYWVGQGHIPSTNPHNSAYWDNGTPTGISGAINSGAFIVQHRDHGLESGWGEPYYRSVHLNDLTNDMYTHVNSTNCLTGRYHYSSEVFAEKFHRIPYGASGVNAASSVSFSFVNDTYIWGMFDALWNGFDSGYPAFDMTGHDNLRPCMSNTSGKYYLETSWFPGAVGCDQYKNITYGLFHHMGDCFAFLYSEIPQDLTVAHDPGLPEGQDFFIVTADDSSVIALTVNGEIIGVDEGTGSPLNITIISQTQGDTMLVTITKANYNRYTALVPVGPPQAIEEETSNELITGVRLYPLVSHGQPITLAYGFAKPTKMHVSIFDALGRFIEHEDYGICRGSGEFSLKFKSYAQGVYFVKVQADNQTTTKIIWLK